MTRRTTHSSREYLLESVGKGCSQKSTCAWAFEDHVGLILLTICRICQRLRPQMSVPIRHPEPWILCSTCPVQIADLPGLLVVDSPMEDCPICLTELCPGENVWRLGKPFDSQNDYHKKKDSPWLIGAFDYIHTLYMHPVGLYISYMIFVSF